MINDKSQGKISAQKNLLLHVDGGCQQKNPGGVVTAGWVIYDPKYPSQPLVEQAMVVQDGGPLATNNFGEYNALLMALNWLRDNNWQGNLTAKADSKLLVEQVCGRWKCKAEHLIVLRDKIWKCLAHLNFQNVNSDDYIQKGKNTFNFTWVKRDLNKRADQLCSIAYDEYINSKLN